MFGFLSKFFCLGFNLSDSSSDRTTTLGRELWEGPFLPSPILVGQAEEVSLRSSWIFRVLALRDKGCANVGSIGDIKGLLGGADAKG